MHRVAVSIVPKPPPPQQQQQPPLPPPRVLVLLVLVLVLVLLLLPCDYYDNYLVELELLVGTAHVPHLLVQHAWLGSGFRLGLGEGKG